MKKKIIPIILTLIIWFIMFYIMLPPLNIKSHDSWNFIIIAVLVAVIINMWTLLSGMFETFRNREKDKAKRVFKIVLGIILIFVVIYGVGNLLSSPILRARAYRELLKVENSDFTDDIKEVNYNQIPILDKDSAQKLAERKMGSMVDMVSQYEVADNFSQINYQSRPVRVTPLKYGDIIKWFTNKKTGIPAYIKIDMTTQDVDCIKLEEGIKYSPYEHFGRNLYRYLRFKYPTAMIRNMNFEIDDDGIPIWICPVADHTIGLFGGTDIRGAIIVNAINGEHQYYNIEDIPQWIDGVYDAKLLIEQYNYYGTLKNGYINSVFGQRDCLKTTQGYNYMALNDDVWLYTGITSVGGDESNVGFVLINQRTKETKYYVISGAEEFSAMSSAEGQVQNLGYKATFPLLINIGEEPTYFLALKDGAGLVKKYAMVNIEKYQIVAIGDTVSECDKNYRELMKNNGVNVTSNTLVQTVSGKIVFLKDIVYNGNTVYYIMIEGNNDLFEITAKDNIDIIRKSIGSEIYLEYTKNQEQNINIVTDMK